ncbi:MAG: hypothetical protein H0T47_20745 [Planctomycetaceae bacterium]|nr:hypothetical protein [Planctomycetaceae bacterium]
MQALLIAISLAATSVETYPTPELASAALVTQVQTGTLLFSEGECLAVKAFTGSRYTHVATVVVADDQPIVYDSQNGVGVRKLPLSDYLAAMQPEELHVLQPSRPFSEKRTALLVEALEQELGRPYGVSHHLTGDRAAGLHCAEYATDALIAAKVVKAEHPPRVSPASLRRGLLRHELYVEEASIVIAAEEPTRPPGRNTCHELWLDTKDCCIGCWGGFYRRVMCR